MRRPLACWLTLLIGWTSIAPSHASPWAQTGDPTFRHHLQTLVDAGILDAVVTSWPVMWATVMAELDKVSSHELSLDQLWSFHYLRHELRKHTQPVTYQKQTHWGNQSTAIGHFGSMARDSAELQVGMNYLGGNSALTLNAWYVRDPDDNRQLRLDGSQASYLLGNWAVGVGAVDRWWGPGWESSLIMSQNARPIPGIFVQRNHAQAFSTPWLSWLGPWQLTAQMGYLETDRHIANPRLWSARFSFRPLQSLELGLSHVAMWAGEGRPGDVDTFIKLLRGRSNIDEYDNTPETEPGNQLAGVDWRWGFAGRGFSGSLYGQLIGEDEAGGLPSRHMGMAGGELQTYWRDTHMRFSVEGQNTRIYFYRSGRDMPNTAYEHHIYRTGYRYRDRPIGASSDNDTEAYTLRKQLFFNNGMHLNASLGRLQINRDGRNRPAPGGSVFGSGRVDTYLTQIQFSAPISDHYRIALGVFNYSNAVHYSGQEMNAGGFINLLAHW